MRWTILGTTVSFMANWMVNRVSSTSLSLTSFGSSGGLSFQRLAKLILEDRSLVVVEHTGNFLLDGIHHVFLGHFNAWVSAEREQQKRGEDGDLDNFPDSNALVEAAVASVHLPAASLLAQSGYTWLRQSDTSLSDEGASVVSRADNEELRDRIMRHKIMTDTVTGAVLKSRKQQMSRSTTSVRLEAHQPP
mmetsp:Transcript_79810/g.158599  ORF Transcript_79810/g.158599 Transcript_79810/m.158599 type:complete len:191 (+) Transcript_79810:119-691(+)